MKLGFSACNYPPRPMRDSIYFAKEHGFDFLELEGWQLDSILFDGKEEEISSAIRECRMPVTIHHALPKPDSEEKVAEFHRAMEREHAFIAAHMDYVQVLSFDTWVDRAKSLPNILFVLDLFSDLDLPIATEDFPLNDKDAELWAPAMKYPHFCILSDLGHTNVRLSDTGEQKIWCLWNEGENLPLPAGDNSPEAFRNALLRKPRPIVQLHVHNNDGKGDQHKALTDGTADYAAIVRVLKEIGFDGLVDLEVSPTIHGITGDDADRVLLGDRDYFLRLWNEN